MKKWVFIFLLGSLFVPLAAWATESETLGVVSVDTEKREIVLKDADGVNRTVRPSAEKLARFHAGETIPAADVQRMSS
jgi:hypothetical protein